MISMAIFLRVDCAERFFTLSPLGPAEEGEEQLTLF